jgi:hypothetical protein
MSPRRRRAVEVVLGSIALIALVLSVMTAAGAVTLPILGDGSNGLNDLGAIGQGLGQTPAKVAVAKRAEPPFVATPVAPCGPGSHPEPGVDGRVPSGTGVNGLWCNMSEISHQGTSGGFKVFRYVDTQGHVCAFYDTALLFPTNAINAAGPSLGVAVLDMDDPAHPVQTDTLTQVPMMTPHESLNLNTTRGLLAAVNGNPATEPGLVSIYDVHADCRHPVLDSTTLVARFGHESGFSPDGKTFYATSTALPSITAVDVTDPKHPTSLWEGNIYSHGMTLSDDGNRAYIADPNGGDMLILDTSQIQARVANPQATEISRLTWTSASIPQNAIPFTENGHPYVLEFDEYTQATLNPTGDSNAVGAARIIDISDETKPFVVANLRLQVDQPADHQAASGDPGTLSPAQGYAAHYCNIPTQVNPKIVACSFIASGLRLFDISHLTVPKEIGYFVSPTTPNTETGYSESDYAMSKPAFDTARHDIWYTDGGTGFYVVHVADGVWPTGTAPKAHGGCPAAAGGASGRSLGTVKLGMTRGGVRRACARANGIRVAYVRGRVVAAVTSNRHYSLDGVTPGTRLARAAKLVKLGRGVRIGKNTWYLPSAGRSRGLLEARHGVIRRVGIAEKSPTAGRAPARRLLKRLR